MKKLFLPVLEHNRHSYRNLNQLLTKIRIFAWSKDEGLEPEEKVQPVRKLSISVISICIIQLALPGF